MCETLLIEVNKDGTATAYVGSKSGTFPNLDAAVEWATKLIYDLEGQEIG